MNRSSFLIFLILIFKIGHHRLESSSTIQQTLIIPAVIPISVPTWRSFRFVKSKPTTTSTYSISDAHNDWLAENNANTGSSSSTSISSSSSNTESIVSVSVSSIIGCAMLCVSGSVSSCVSMEFQEDAKFCLLYPPSLAALNKAYRKVAECPSDFMFDQQAGKCYKLIAKKATWLDSRLACNALGSHPVIAASSSDTNILLKFMELPSLVTNMTYCGYTFWSSGMGFSPPTNLTYVWRPYATKSKDIFLPMKYTNWDVTQPDNAGGIEGYVHIKTRGKANWNDLPNSSLLCVLCEVDMN